MNFNTFLMPENNYQPDLNLKNRVGRDEGKSMKTRKAAVVFLAVLGVFFIGAGLYQMNSRIKRPFTISKSNMTTGGGSAEERYLSVLQTRDTDGDGLSDYDEIYIYKTSPYLEDTDSDGFSDYEEVLNFTDPNCPQGMDCYGLGDSFTEATSSPTLVLPEVNPSITVGVDTEDEKLMQSLSTGEIDVNILRAMLISNGLNEEEINQISDDDLKAIYLQAVANETKEAAAKEAEAE